MDDRPPPPSSSAYPLGLQPFFGEDAAAAAASSTSSYATAASSPSPAPAAPTAAAMPPSLDPSVGAVNALLMQTAVPFSSKIYNVDRWRRETPPAATAATAAPTTMAMSSSSSGTHYGIGGIGSGHGALSPPPPREIYVRHEGRRATRATGPLPFTPLTPAPPPLRSKCS